MSEFPLFFFCWASRPETWLWARHASFSRAWNLPFRNIETTHLAGAFLGTLRSGIHTKKMLGFMNQYSALTEISCIYSHFTLKSSTQQEMWNQQIIQCANFLTNFAETNHLQLQQMNDFVRASHIRHLYWLHPSGLWRSGETGGAKFGAGKKKTKKNVF